MHDRHSCTNTFTSERQCTWAARAMRAYTMSFCYVQRLHRIITSEQLVSPHHSAREMIEVMKNRDFTKLFQKSVRKVQFYHCCLIICLISIPSYISYVAQDSVFDLFPISGAILIVNYSLTYS